MAMPRNMIPSLSSISRNKAIALDFRDPFTIYMWAVLAVCVAIAALFWFMSFKPTMNEIEVRRSEFEKQSAELDRVLKEAARKPQFEADVQKAQEELTTLREMFPDEEKVPLRLNDLYIAIRQAGVRIISLEPISSAQGSAKAPPPKADAASDDPTVYYRENAYKLEMEGGYHQMGDMFAEVANFDYPTRIVDLRVRRFSGLKNEIETSKRHGTIPVTMSVSFKLITFSSRK